MYAEFTHRTAEVMSLANQEARLLNHEFIGAEHILLGLLKEGSGRGVEILRGFGVDAEKLSAEVETLIEAESGPDEVATGQCPQSPEAQKVMERAIKECRSLGAGKLGTEHLLLGILGAANAPAAKLLTRHGLNADNVRQEVRNPELDQETQQ